MAKVNTRKKLPASTAKKKTVATKKPVKKTVAAKTPAKKSAPKKTAKPVAKKTIAKKPVAKKSVTKKAPAKQTSKPVAKKTATKKPVKKSTPATANNKTHKAKIKTVAKPTKKSTSASAPAKPVAAAKPVTNTKKPSTPMPKTTSKSAPAEKAVAPIQPQPRKSSGNYKPVALPAGYKPGEKEEYMNAQQVEYFRQKLLKWRADLLAESRETLDHLHDEDWHQADIADRASLETEAGVELRTRNRYLKLISKIDAAIQRIEEGEYGYCEDTGEPIGIKRLEARPVATLSIEAQERHEKMEKQYTDED